MRSLQRPIARPPTGALLAFLAQAAAVGCVEEPPARRTPSAMLPAEPLLIAHRGASAYAPEHTLAAYRLGLEQGADVIEPDLQMTRDGVLIALHDETLERTTDVAARFPDRYREDEAPDGSVVRRWYARDFTLEEIRTLDAGSWFGDQFADERVPTFQEVIDLVRGRAGLIPETKSPQRYLDAEMELEAALVAELETAGIAGPASDPSTPVYIQSFDTESLRRLRQLGVSHPLILLIGSRGEAEQWLTDEGMDRLAEFAQGIGPNKGLLLAMPEAADRARGRGLLVTPWTFRERDPGAFESVEEEMSHFLCELGVSGLFTDNPDLFPRGCE